MIQFLDPMILSKQFFALFGPIFSSLECSLLQKNRDFAFFVFERTKHQPRRNLRSYLVLQRLCNETALSPGIDAFWY